MATDQCSSICRALSLLMMSIWLAEAVPAIAAEPASQPAASTSPAGKSSIVIAVLNASSSTGEGESEMVVGELAKAMETTRGVVVVDRDHVRKVLAEHRLSLAGLVQQPVKHGGMLGVKYFLYAQTQENASARTLAILCIEVSSGNVIWERAFDVHAIGDAKSVSQWASGVAGEARTAMAANETRMDRATATVLSVTNRSSSDRLDFLEGSLQGLLEDLLESRGYRVLRRRNPGLLAKETTLGISGMVRPDSAVLAEAADLVVTASYVESPSGDVAFESTPIKMTLGLKRRAVAIPDATLAFTLADIKGLRGKLESVLPATASNAGTTSAPTDDHLSRRLEAARLMAELRPSEYTLPLEKQRHQIELAQRIIYLDPSAKEAYFCLGESLDSLTRQTWHAGGTHEGSSQETVDAFYKYLSFPRTNKEHVWSAFRGLLTHVSVLNKAHPENDLPLMAEFVRWEHELDPVKPPRAMTADFYFNDWWDRNPQQRLDFYTWVDQLYTKKRHLSVVPFQMARAYDQLKQPEKAAGYYYDGFVSHGLSRLQLNSVARNGDESRAMQLAKYLDAKRAAQLQARLGRPEKPGTGLSEMYGTAYSGESLTDYARHADAKRLTTLDIQVGQPEVVAVDKPLLQSLVVRHTQAGLWMQGGTTEGKMALFFSADGRSWKVVKTPEAMTTVHGFDDVAESNNHVVSIVQLGDEVLFATLMGGLFVYDSRKDQWRQYGPKEGLAAKAIVQMTVSADGKSAWIAGGGFLCRYQDGKLFMPKAKIAPWLDGMIAVDKRLLVLGDGTLSEVEPDTGRTTNLLTRAQQQGLLPTPSIFSGSARSCNAGINTWQRLLLVGQNVYFVSGHGVAVSTAAGRPVALWRPDTFYRWQYLGGWVLGNCPLPPCALQEVIRDDQKPHVLWLISKDNDVIPPYKFGYATYPKPLWNSILDIGGDRSCFITALDTKTNRFSKPVRTKSAFTHAAPFGDHVYLTGRTFTRLPKKLWTMDQSPAEESDSPKVECADTLVGRASRALLLGDKQQALANLRAALDAHISPTEVDQMMRALAAQPQPASQPSTMPVGRAVSPVDQPTSAKASIENDDGNHRAREPDAAAADPGRRQGSR